MNQQVEAERDLLWKSEKPESMVSVTIGRAMSSLLNSRFKKLQTSVSHFSPSSTSTTRPLLGSLEDSLWFVYCFAKDAAERGLNLDEVLIPIIEHSFKYKDSKHGGQDIMLVDWLFRDESLFQAVASNLANIVKRKDDSYISFGWCILVRGLVEYESAMDQCTLNGLRDNYNALVKMLCSCIPHLLLIVRKGSILQDGFELPSRLAVSAADCILTISESLTKKTKVSTNKPKSLNLSGDIRPVALLPAASADNKVKPTSQSLETLNTEMMHMLWDNVDYIIALLERLVAWSRKSRPLHLKGVEQVLKWLQDVKVQYGGSQNEAGANIKKAGSMLLSSCWKHYSILLHLEDQRFSQRCNELLEQYISGIQSYTDNHTAGHSQGKDGGTETRKFFLNCLCLLLGRIESKKFERVVSEHRIQLSHVLLSQLYCADEDVSAGALCILRTAIFRPCYTSDCDGRLGDTTLPLLLHLLDEQDGTSRAVIILIAEYCSMSANDHCLQEVLKRLASEHVMQRRNAIDIISKLVCMSSDLENKLSLVAWKDIANQLLERLSDEDTSIRDQASKLLSVIEPSLVLPALVHLLHSSDERTQSLAASPFISMLQHHNQKPEVICMLLDCLSNPTQMSDHESANIRQEQNMDIDRILKLVQEWAKSVKDWNSMVGPLIDKMFSEPANATIVRFLSSISEHLSEAADVVLHRVLLRIKMQKEYFAMEVYYIDLAQGCIMFLLGLSASLQFLRANSAVTSDILLLTTVNFGRIDESSLSRWESRTCADEDSTKMQQCLFERLCPLLLIRLLPLQVFSDVSLRIMYGELDRQSLAMECGDINIVDNECVAAFLLKRAFGRSEFGDVRKLAAELCGRLCPEVLFPVVSSMLDYAASSHDTLRIKACIFSVCTSLMVRGSLSISQPLIPKIRKTLETILLWSPSDGEEVSKAQHGCIDCLALMICAELQALGSFKNSSEKFTGMRKNSGSFASGDSILTYALNQMVKNDNEVISNLPLNREKLELGVAVPNAYRICMANVLISACQKVSDPGKKPFAQKTLPFFIDNIKVINRPEITAACVQVLFSAVYHLKSAVLPYSSDLLKLSVMFLKEGSDKERMAGAKLLASLLASDDEILERISEGLLEAKFVLSTLSVSDPLYDMRQICKQLLACLTCA